MGSRSSHWDSGSPGFLQSAGQFQLLHKPELSCCQAINFILINSNSSLFLHPMSVLNP